MLSISLFQQVVFYGLDPLGRVGHLKGGGVFLIAVIDKIDFDKGRMQIDPFVGAIVVYPGDTRNSKSAAN